MEKQYDILVCHSVKGVLFRANVRNVDSADGSGKKVLDFGTEVHGASTLYQFEWRDEEGKLYKVNCSGQITYLIIPRTQVL